MRRAFWVVLFFISCNGLRAAAIAELQEVVVSGHDGFSRDNGNVVAAQESARARENVYRRCRERVDCCAVVYSIGVAGYVAGCFGLGWFLAH